MQSKKDSILTFTAEAANSSVKLTAVGSPPAVTLEYNLNGGGWLPYTVGNVISLPNVGDNVKMRGNNTVFTSHSNHYNKFELTGLVAASGDITSLLNNIGGDVKLLSNNTFMQLFFQCNKLVTAPNLPSTSLSVSCYTRMFSYCSNLANAPKLPATIVMSIAYYSMFDHCTNLISVPKIEVNAIENQGIQSMFANCSKVKSYRFTTINNSKNVFENNLSCETFVIEATIPPTIASNTITGLKSDCKIYVPYSEDHSILNAYKAKQYWSDRANYIYELDENGNIPS